MALIRSSPVFAAWLAFAGSAWAGAGRDPLEQADPQVASTEVGRALQARGEEALEAGRYEDGQAAFESAEEIARTGGREPERAAALWGLAETLFRRANLVPAIAAAEEAARVYAGLGDPSGEAEALNTLGHARHARAEHPEAFAAYRRAYELWNAAGNTRSAARALNNLGNCYKAKSELDAALDHYEQALRYFEQTGDRARAAVVTTNIGLIHYDRGEYRLAEVYCARALAENETLGVPERIAKSLDALGNIARARGAYARASDYFRRSLAISEPRGFTFQVLETSNNLGLVHFRQGDYERAIDAYKRGLRLNRKMGGTTLVAEGLYNIASAARRLGQRPRAAANYRESLRVCEREGFKALAAANLNDLGRMALEAGRLSDAGRLLERARKIRDALKDRAGTTETLNGLALLRLAEGRPRDALQLSQRSADLARSYEHAEHHWEAETLSGQAHRQLGETEAARSSFREAIRVIEELRREVVPRPQGRERFFESKLSPYHELMALALANGSQAEALELADRSKARVLAELVQSADLDLAVPPGEVRAEDARRRTALASLNQQLQAERLKDAPDASRLAALEEERRTRRTAYEEFQASVHLRQPESGAGERAVRPFAFGEAERLLASPSAAVLEYVVTEKQSYLFVLTLAEGRLRLQATPLALDGPALASLAYRFRDQLARRDFAFGEDARRLYDQLLLPALPAIRDRTQLVVIPDGALWEVPFQALQDARGRYVIESAAVSYAPSLAVLRQALDRKVSPRDRLPTLLAMGRSDFGPQVARAASVLPALPEAERQVRLIAAQYGPERSFTYLGMDAREDLFKTEAPHHRILHLATHGVLDETSPLYSHVVLAPGTGGSSGDGLLEAWELLDLKLDAELVVLSACETGRGRIAPGEGIIGTMWAFLVAGSRALLVAKWKVESSSTTELMSSFHARLARAEGAKAEQLRQASLDLLRQPRRAHPFYWAGFALVGNPY